jgi:hypothetical protein
LGADEPEFKPGDFVKWSLETKMFISQLIDGHFYYIAEKPSAKAPAHFLRWSIVPHKPEPIVRVHYSDVPRYIREQCERLFNGDSRRQYNENGAQHNRSGDRRDRARAGKQRLAAPQIPGAVVLRHGTARTTHGQRADQ